MEWPSPRLLMARGMVNYDMAVGGVDSNSALYLDESQSPNLCFY